MLYCLLAYLMWGVFPLFFPLLEPSTPVEIIGHRIVWTAVFMVLVVMLTRKWKEVKQCTAKEWMLVALAGVLVAVNWLVYVWSVNNGHVAEAALGYFINPLVSVLLGVIFLGESLSRLQAASVALAGIAVLVLTFVGGNFPFLALSLAFSFGFYGLVKKRIRLSATASLTAETLVVLPVALGYLLYLEARGVGTFGHISVSHSLLLMSAGLVTALPLIFFGMATKVIPLSTIGIMQYLTPTIQMLMAVFLFEEQLEPVRWLGFVIIWISVALYIADVVLTRRRFRRISRTRSEHPEAAA
ncbi:EamA family transporter RarD [Corynebacterium sp. ZY180755]